MIHQACFTDKMAPCLAALSQKKIDTNIGSARRIVRARDSAEHNSACVLGAARVTSSGRLAIRRQCGNPLQVPHRAGAFDQ